MPVTNHEDDGCSNLKMRALRAWRRRWVYELSGMHRIPLRSPMLFCFLILLWFPVVALWWYTGADQYRSVAWLTSSTNDAQSRRPESVALLVSTQQQTVNWKERLNHFDSWWHQTKARLQNNETPSPIDDLLSGSADPQAEDALPGWDIAVRPAGRMEVNTPYGKVIGVDATGSVWYVAAWSDQAKISSQLAAYYGERLVHHLNAFEEEPQAPSPEVSNDIIKMRRKLSEARAREQRAQERLESCYAVDDFGLLEIVPNAVSSSILTSLQSEEETLQEKLEELTTRHGPNNPTVKRQQTFLLNNQKRQREEVLKKIGELEEKVSKARSVREEMEQQLNDLEGERRVDAIRSARLPVWSVWVEPGQPWLPDRQLGTAGWTVLCTATLLLTWISALFIRRMRRVVRIPEDLALPVETIVQLDIQNAAIPVGVRAEIDALTSTLGTEEAEMRWAKVLFNKHPSTAPRAYVDGPAQGVGGALVIHGVQAGRQGAAGALAVAQMLATHAGKILIIDHRDDHDLSTLVGEDNPWRRRQQLSARGSHGKGFIQERQPSPLDVEGVWYVLAAEIPKELQQEMLLPGQQVEGSHPHARSNGHWNTILRVYSDGHRFEADRLAQGSGCVLIARAGKTTRRQWKHNLEHLGKLTPVDPWAVLVRAD